MRYEKIPFVNKLYFKYKKLEEEISQLSDECIDIAQDGINSRLALKQLQGEKIKVVFICWRPAVWDTLKPVYEAMKNDDAFDVDIIAIPNKKQLPKLGLMHETYESEGAEDFWKEYGCYNGYNYETYKWLNPKALKPDYVFLQQPYNIARSKWYKSDAIAKYAKICYMHYFMPIAFDDTLDEATPLDFMKHISLLFAQNLDDKNYLEKRIVIDGVCKAKISLTGCPRYDGLEERTFLKSPFWIDDGVNRFKIVWTPRWTTNEGNCHFFDYVNNFIYLCESDSSIDFVFRPHPQAFLNWQSTGELPEAKQLELRNTFEKNTNMHLDETKSYIDLIYSSDCLVTDRSTIINDYFMTGRPIIYCNNGSKHEIIGSEISKCVYNVSNWNDLKETLMNLKNSIDPLAERRHSILKKNRAFSNNHAGELIKELIKKDATRQPIR